MTGNGYTTADTGLIVSDLVPDSGICVLYSFSGVPCLIQSIEYQFCNNYLDRNSVSNSYIILI